MNEPQTALGKRIKAICDEWKATRPKNKKRLKYLADDIGLAEATLQRAIKGEVSKDTIEIIADKLGYNYTWVAHGTGPKTGKEIDKKRGMLDLVSLAAEIDKLRDDVYSEQSENKQLRVDIDHLKRELKELKDKITIYR